ncbi:unnamed protein product, partial [Ectocarpus sp. 12 AP-2014]
ACPPAADLQEGDKPRGVMKFCDTLEQQRKFSPVEWSASFLNYKLLKKKIKTMANTQPEGHDKPSATTPEALA